MLNDNVMGEMMKGQFIKIKRKPVSFKSSERMVRNVFSNVFHCSFQFDPTQKYHLTNFIPPLSQSYLNYYLPIKTYTNRVTITLSISLFLTYNLFFTIT